MTRALSQDLRSRVIAAVDGGISCNAAADRFGIAVSSAIRWVRAWRVEGRVTALPQGGDLRSHHIEAYRDVILAAIEAKVDITLVELSDLLRHEHRASFAPSTVWRFLERRCGRGAGPPRRCVPTWRPARQPQRWGERAPGADEPIHPSALVALQSASWQPARHGSAAPGGRCSFAC